MKKILLGLLVVFILMQFIRPEKNLSADQSNLIHPDMTAPPEVEHILRQSCTDCHSDFTVYPWYAEIAPVSWYLSGHVNNGKRHLNFTHWSSYNKDQKSHIIEDLKEELTDKNMPLKSYLILHDKAKLNAAQYDQLLAWVSTLKKE